MIQGIIFDMDGVLVDTEPVYLELVKKFLSSCQIRVTDSELMDLVGASHKTFQQKLAQWWERDTREEREPEELDAWFEAYCNKHPFHYSTVLNPGVRETLEQLKSSGYKIALASSSPRKDIRKVLTDCRLDTAFTVIVSGEQFQRSKPDPEIYRYTLEQLGLPASKCLAVEDSAYGITAASLAGIRVIAKREERFGFSQSQADGIIDEIPQILAFLD